MSGLGGRIRQAGRDGVKGLECVRQGSGTGVEIFHPPTQRLLTALLSLVSSVIIIIVTTTTTAVGLDCVVSTQVRVAQSRLRGGPTQSMFVLCKRKDAKFEFIFTHGGQGASGSGVGTGAQQQDAHNTSLFTTVQTVVK